MISQLCMQHQLHLAVQKNLHRTGASKYVSRLAMVCHLWRSPGMLAKIRQRFAEKFDEATARRCSACPPPTPIRGRWGSVHLSERFVLRCQWNELRSVPRSQLLIAHRSVSQAEEDRQGEVGCFREPLPGAVGAGCCVIGDRRSSRGGRGDSVRRYQQRGRLLGRRPVLRTPRLEEVLAGRSDGPQQHQKLEDQEATALLGEATSAYQARLGKWAREVLLALSSPQWWGELLASNVLRGPLQRAMCWLQTASTSVGEHSRAEALPPIVEWVTSRAVLCMDEYSSLLDSDAWDSAGAWAGKRAHEPQTHDWRGSIMLQLVEMAGDIFRRVVLPTMEMPQQLAWIAFASPDKPCSARRHVCNLLLASGNLVDRRPGTETLTGLLRLRFTAELERCVAENGVVDLGLHRLMSGVPGSQRIRWTAMALGSVGPGVTAWRKIAVRSGAAKFRGSFATVHRDGRPDGEQSPEMSEGRCLPTSLVHRRPSSQDGVPRARVTFVEVEALWPRREVFSCRFLLACGLRCADVVSAVSLGSLVRLFAPGSRLCSVFLEIP